MIYYAAHSHSPGGLIRHDVPSEEQTLDGTIALSIVEASDQVLKTRPRCAQQSAGAHYAQIQQPTVINMILPTQMMVSTQPSCIKEGPGSRSFACMGELVGQHAGGLGGTVHRTC